MATWHQIKNPINLQHATQWTVYENPLGRPAGVMRFETEAEALTYKANRVKYGAGAEYLYLIQPAGADQIQYDYDKQCYIINGRYVRCGHPQEMDCGCYGKEHEGEKAPNIH